MNKPNNRMSQITVSSIFIFSYNGKSYDDHPNSPNIHRNTALGNIDNRLISVGGSRGTNQNPPTAVELFDITSNTWTTKGRFPYCRLRWVKIVR